MKTKRTPRIEPAPRRPGVPVIVLAAGLPLLTAAMPPAAETGCSLAPAVAAQRQDAADSASKTAGRRTVVANCAMSLPQLPQSPSLRLECSAIVANRPAGLPKPPSVEPGDTETASPTPSAIVLHASEIALAELHASALLQVKSSSCAEADAQVFGYVVSTGATVLPEAPSDPADAPILETDTNVSLVSSGGMEEPPAESSPGPSGEGPSPAEILKAAKESSEAIAVPDESSSNGNSSPATGEPPAPTPPAGTPAPSAGSMPPPEPILGPSLDSSNPTAYDTANPPQESASEGPADADPPRASSSDTDRRADSVRDFNDFGFRMAFADAASGFGDARTGAAASPARREEKPAAPRTTTGIAAKRVAPADEPLLILVGETARLKSGAPIERVELTNPDIADMKVLSPHDILLSGKVVGNTRVLVSSREDKQEYEVMVTPNLRMLQSLIKAVAPRGDVQVQPLNGSIVLTGTVSDPESVERIAELAAASQGAKVINQLSVAGCQQTMLRVSVAEVNKEAMRALGVNWAIGASTLSRDFFLANNLGQLNPTNFSSNGLPNVLSGQQIYSVAPVGTSPLTNLTFGFPRAELQYFLNALRENRLARVLAEPNLVAISGQTATFLAGGEVPIPVSQGGAVAGAITIDYKEFGVRLGFTPTVMAGQIVRLHVMTEVSDIVDQSREIGSVPLYSFRTRRVETTIECGNGQTFAIGGLLNERVSSIASKLPGLGDMPVLGALFSSVEYQQSRTELIVLVTPELVEPLNPNQVPPPPGAEMLAPNDYELFALGKLEGEKPPSAGPPEQEQPAQPDPAGATPAQQAGAMQVRGPWGMEDEYAGAAPAAPSRP